MSKPDVSDGKLAWAKRATGDFMDIELSLDEPHLRSGLNGEADRLPRDALLDNRGITYRAFRRTLTPQFRLVWLHLLCGHIALLLVSVCLIVVDQFGTARDSFMLAWHAPPIIVGGLAYGYIIAYIALFF